MDITLTQLKILAGYLVTESTDTGKDEKIKLLKSIQAESSEYQLMSMLLDGKRVADETEEGKLTLEGRFIASELYELMVVAQQSLLEGADPDYSRDLRIFAGSIITDSKLTKAAKLQMLSFVEGQATDEQIMVFILDGKIIKLDEQSAELAKDRFAASDYPVQMEAGVLGNVMGMLFFSPQMWAAWRILKAAAGSECNSKCGIFRVAKDRDACLAKCKIGIANKKIALINKNKAECGKAKNPKSCIKGAEKAIAKEKAEILKLQTKMKKLEKKGRGYYGTSAD